MNFFQAHGPKTMKLFITKSCGDAKLELFPGARPPDTTFTSWYDLTLALVPPISNSPIMTPKHDWIQDQNIGSRGLLNSVKGKLSINLRQSSDLNLRTKEQTRMMEKMSGHLILMLHVRAGQQTIFWVLRPSQN